MSCIIPREQKGLYYLIRQCCYQSTSITEVEVNHIEYQLSEKFSFCKDLKTIESDILNIFEHMLDFDSKINDNAEELADRIEDYIRNHYAESLSLEDIATKFNFSVSYITKIYKRCKNESILKYLITLRINEAKRLLEHHHEMEVKSISELVGYSDQHYFSRIFKNVTGMNPSEYKVTKGSSIPKLAASSTEKHTTVITSN